MRRVRPLGSCSSFQAQVMCGLSQRSKRLGSGSLILNAVLSFTFATMGPIADLRMSVLRQDVIRA
jgi:hypothetical protein